MKVQMVELLMNPSASFKHQELYSDDNITVFRDENTVASDLSLRTAAKSK